MPGGAGRSHAEEESWLPGQEAVGSWRPGRPRGLTEYTRFCTGHTELVPTCQIVPECPVSGLPPSSLG